MDLQPVLARGARPPHRQRRRAQGLPDQARDAQPRRQSRATLARHPALTAVGCASAHHTRAPFKRSPGVSRRRCVLARTAPAAQDGPDSERQAVRASTLPTRATQHPRRADFPAGSAL
ncbi:hypothetical protein Rumeso_01081 [Rubellimicrobium mesophilum DSM 19309]|uniref:Uncharacterized protein n=1 Tax=Rubellimicrobium mesophilum DSM 19309 TaxID=442562 RepID=A0A017HUD8_9RHOB|nr:hypothetical protein Rumeso_01081 [Rubellimicrobium mesophilum DSM 19309]